MRKLLRKLFKTYFHNHLVHTRSELAWTQEQMAEVLAMAERSFIDLDHGKSCCSGATLALYLTYCCDDPQKFLQDFKDVYEKEAKCTND